MSILQVLFFLLKQNLLNMSHTLKNSLTLLIFVGLTCFACRDTATVNISSKPAKLGTTLFNQIPAHESGIYFKNPNSESQTNNLFTNNLVFGGGGAAAGDLNNDGLPDIVLISNEGVPGIYLNEGDFKFKAAVAGTGIGKTTGWQGGVSIIDLNLDGKMDIYINRGGTHVRSDEDRRNLLYINQGNMKFVEKAKEYGLDDPGVSVTTVFFDYDLDGDLDAYTVNYLPGMQRIGYDVLQRRRNNPEPEIIPNFSDHLYKNENGKFIDVTTQAGIQNFGCGLGVAVGDLNQDGYPDLYVTNDLEVDDFYFKNNGDGTFTESLKSKFPHVSYYAMGVDIGDINNDGFLDVYEVEMLPKDRKRALTNMSSMDVGRFNDLQKYGMQVQYMRNCMHLNRGNGHFSEIAQLGGVAKTDWSWGTLIKDIDDDGLKDILVTNGIPRDMKNRDFQKKANEIYKASEGVPRIEAISSNAPSVKIKNFAYKNLDGLQFKNATNDWGLDQKGFSNGLVTADFDLDGDLDVLMNNIDDYPFLYQNTSKDRGANSLNVALKGPAKNPQGIGAKLTIETENGKQYQEMYNIRGFQSCSDPIVHFGLGDLEEVKELKIEWPGGKTEVIKNPDISKRFTVNYKNASSNTDNKATKTLVQVARSTGINFKHKEKTYDDFKKEILLPHKMSQNGPFLSKADVNKDGLEDFYVGGAKDQAGALFVQKPNNTFTRMNSSAFIADKAYEDMGSVFFDADQDGDVDLYVVSGSNEFENNKKMYQDRLYLNDGAGNYTKSNMLPSITSSGAKVSAGDFDADGDLDLFVGGRVLPQAYPKNPKSYLLINQNGKFVDKTNTIAKELQLYGMITDATWLDVDKDYDLDLITVGEWSPITIWENTNNKLTKKVIANTDGWWTSISPADLDQDGDIDFVIGNIGLNHKFKASDDKPLHIYCDDFDDTGTNDIVLAYHTDDNLFPVRGRDCSSEQMPFIKEKFPTFDAFSDASLQDIYGDKLDKALHKEAKMFSSIILRNNNGQLDIEHLPVEAQFSCVNKALALDVDQNKILDLFLVGNMFQTEAETSRADASIGLFLQAEQVDKYNSMSVNDSGFFTPNDAKDMIALKNASGYTIVVANNDSNLDVFSLNGAVVQ